MNDADAINRHYAQSDLCRRILDTLSEAGKDIDNLQSADIATFEEFHTGGRRETLNLAKLIPIEKKHRVLDIGCGVGGPARTLASEFGCHVTGIDLTREFVLASRMLSVKVGLKDKTRFEQADALNLPCNDSSFDIIWMQHVSSNIENKSALFAEINRVLKSDGLLAVHEFIRTNDQPLEFPVFWAPEQSISFLVSANEYRRVVSKNVFVEEDWQDTTERSIEWFEKVVRNMNAGGVSPLGSRLILGDDAPLKAANVLNNLKSGAVGVIQAVFKKSPK